LIDAGRETIIASERAEIYRQASDLVMELAVELPVYQRSDMNVYNSKVLDANTFKKNITPFSGPLSEMWKVSFIEG
jgi:peptide/nickel transport system substrate-binding protein